MAHILLHALEYSTHSYHRVINNTVLFSEAQKQEHRPVAHITKWKYDDLAVCFYKVHNLTDLHYKWPAASGCTAQIYLLV